MQIKEPSQLNDDEFLDPEEQRALPRDKEYYFRQCYQSVPPVIPNNETRGTNAIPVNVDAFNVSGYPDHYVYKEDVNLIQGDKYLAADKLTYYTQDEFATAEGHVNFINGDMTLYADSMETDLQTNEKTAYNADYQFHGRSGRGEAERVYDNGQDVFELNSATYTVCPPNDTTWQLNATTFYIDNDEEVGSAWNAVLEVKEVPVFYFPYVSYPLTDKRKTGLLFPSVKQSDVNGFSYKQPLYINIAPNMDATITPNYMQNRGTVLAGEFRYLFDVGSGRAQAEYLQDDKIRKSLTLGGDKIDGSSRYLYHWDHNVNFAQNWNFNVRYNKVSDDNYFNDIDTPYGDRSDNQLLQTANLSYREVTWNSEAEVRSFQILGGGNTPHEVLPKIAFSAYKPLNWKSLQFDMYSEVTKFAHKDDQMYEGTRIHVEPKLSLPLNFNSFFVDTELKYMMSYYQQELPGTSNSSNNIHYDALEESTSRALPSFKIHSGLNLERDFSAFGSDYKQTLVPQFQYLYVPYQNQDDIGLYDTTTLYQDYYGLFRDNSYSGYDRIADANQVTVGLTTSFFNARGKEKMRFAIGQNYYLEQSKVDLSMTNKNTNTAEEVTRSSIISSLDLNFEGEYFFHTGAEWDIDNSLLKKGNATIEKRWLYNTYAQLNYRYLYISEEDQKANNIKGFVNQLGSKVNWSVNTQWTTYASYYYDLDYQRSYESIVGVQYQSCCWAIGLEYDNHMLAYYGKNANLATDIETEQSISLTFELTGLGSVGASSADDVGLFDYGRPFYLQ